VTPNGAAVTTTLTVTTTAASAAAALPVTWPLSQRPIYALLFSVLAIMFVLVARRRQQLPGLRLSGFVILLIAAAGLTSCNGGSTTAGNPGTPVGTSSVSVSAAVSGGAINHTATLTITITK
jgi:hypothetical protein